MMEHPLNIKCITKTTDFDGAIYGKFIIEPLEKGYGTTLGNSLRRVLLSSLPGSAITSSRFEGVSHEYTTIPGVMEDVLDILLNLKGVVLSTNVIEQQMIRLDVEKSGVITAGDLDVPANIEVVNKNWPICTLNEGARLHAEMTVESGKGYLSIKQVQGSQTSDALPLDAAFMPIRRVSYQVENTRVGQRTDYDSLVLEIWSNGSMDVTDALSQSANLLIEHLMPIASLAGVPVIVSQAQVEPSVVDLEVPSITVEDLELSVRAFNCLKRANIHSIQELLLKSENDLLNIKNFGKKSSDEVIERLRAFNLDLKPSPAGEFVSFNAD